jgi:hypothetical protein
MQFLLWLSNITTIILQAQDENTLFQQQFKDILKNDRKSSLSCYSFYEMGPYISEIYRNNIFYAKRDILKYAV